MFSCQERIYQAFTGRVEKCLEESGVSEGFILVNAMHITASGSSSTMMNPVCHQDYEKWLEQLAPHEACLPVISTIERRG